MKCYKMKISEGTIVRTVVLAIALFNQVLSILGMSPLNILEHDVETFLSTAFTIGAALVAWWKNNSFTYEAITADNLMYELKEEKKRQK